MDRFALYELCVQSPALMAAFLRAVHGGEPRVLREDFCARAALSRAWVEADSRATAWAIDADAEALGPAGLGADGAAAGSHPRVVRRVGDARERLAGEPRFDVVHAGNFSLGYLARRAELAEYLARSRERLAPGGVLALDTFGGASAFRLGASERTRFLPDGRRVRATWRRVEADPARGMVVNTLSFCVDRDGEIEWELADAFVYRWRLWSLPELSDALAEHGFRKVELFTEIDPERPRPVAGTELGEDFSACVIARV